jgi:hypothetical protein
VGLEATAVYGDKPEGLVNATSELVKLPVVARFQYSDVLMADKVPSKVPPVLPSNACTCAVAVPEVVGLTNA